MTPEERFRFDLQGFLVVPHVLTHDECAELSELADKAWPRAPDDGPYRRVEAFSRWGKPFLDLMDHPTILPYLIELVGSRLRADHDYTIFTQKGTDPHRLHGGPRRYETDHWYYYSDGIMRNGLTVATWALTDVGPGDGGFVCVPGSHKTNFLPHLPDDVRRLERWPDYVHQPPVRAGDVLIFTEALIHGAAPWRAEHERRALLYKYSPPHSSWRKVPYEIGAYPKATERQRRLMAPPSVEDHPKVLEGGREDVRRKP